jgi:hypothetical protein
MPDTPQPREQPPMTDWHAEVTLRVVNPITEQMEGIILAAPQGDGLYCGVAPAGGVLVVTIPITADTSLDAGIAALNTVRAMATPILGEAEVVSVSIQRHEDLAASLSGWGPVP